MAWEVAQICEICQAHGWVQPSVYQGVYNSLNRTVEAELFPCLRHYGMVSTRTVRSVAVSLLGAFRKTDKWRRARDSIPKLGTAL